MGQYALSERHWTFIYVFGSGAPAPASRMREFRGPAGFARAQVRADHDSDLSGEQGVPGTVPQKSRTTVTATHPKCHGQ
jgi:hypothetical protein